MRRPLGTGDAVAFIDFDGVVHHQDVYRRRNAGPTIRAPGDHRLFQHAELLERLFAPFPGVRVVLSTSWCVWYGYRNTVKRLPPGLQARCIGATYHSRIPRAEWFDTPRGIQVSNDAIRRRPRCWFAIDDDDEDWPVETHEHLVLTDPVEGISPAGVQDAITRQLEACTTVRTL